MWMVVVFQGEIHHRGTEDTEEREEMMNGKRSPALIFVILHSSFSRPPLRVLCASVVNLT
jgi:hypothetical protein